MIQRFIGRITWKKILTAVCFLSIAMAAYSALTYGQSIIHSDTAVSFLLAREQVRGWSLFPDGWCYGNGDLWVLGQNLIAIPLTYLISDQSLSRAVQSVILLFLTIWSIWYFCRKELKNDSWLFSVPLFLIYLFGALDMILYQGAYTCQMMFMLLGAALYFTLIKNDCPRKKTIVLFFLFICLLSMGGIRQIAEIAIPLMGAAILRFYIRNKEKGYEKYKSEIRKLIVHLLLVVIPMVAGYVMYLFICRSHRMGNSENNSLKFSGSLDEVWGNLVRTVINAFSVFGFSAGEDVFHINGIRNLISIASCLFIFYIIPFWQIRHYKEESQEMQFFILYGAVHNAVMLILILFFGKTTDRYLLSTVFVFIIWSGNYISKFYTEKNNLKRVAAVFAAAVFTIVQSISLSTLGTGWQARLAGREMVTDVLESKDLRYGYATYWYAGCHTLLSDFKVQVNAVTINEKRIQPHYWLSSEKWYDQEAYKGKTFLMLDDNENRQLKNTKIMKELGNYKDMFKIDGTNLNVYVYDYNIMQYLN